MPDPIPTPIPTPVPTPIPTPIPTPAPPPGAPEQNENTRYPVGSELQVYLRHASVGWFAWLDITHKVRHRGHRSPTIEGALRNLADAIADYRAAQPQHRIDK